ncbi:MAG: hypothetical protein IAG13_30855, partial [Deltaproteobacteria bacterium]|nr:hypothetical protein [Nannocystaceae bacterium]
MTGVGGMSVADFALRLSALRGTAAYAAYVVSAPDMEDVLLDLEEELRTVASHDAVARIAPLDGDHLVTDLAATSIEMIVVDARTFAAHDWALLDRRRSAIAHRGVLVLVTTPTSFNELMRRAPNLASWLGGEVFAYPSDVNATAAAHREQRLAALRAWASQTDEQV